jgi:hypothetical protein
MANDLSASDEDDAGEGLSRGAIWRNEQGELTCRILALIAASLVK